MSSSRNPADPPRMESKFQKPTKQSVFEKQKAEAEAKRKREAAETAAVYEDFVKSFDHDEDDNAEHGATAQRSHRPGFGNLGGPPSGPSGASRRHFGGSSLGMKSGPGSLGMPPMPFAKKRSFNDFSKESEGRATLKFDDKSDDEEMVDRAEEKAIARPTLRLSNLPPGISPATIKSLLPANLTVENVKIQPPAGPGGSERKNAVAIVTLSKETPATDMDAAVSTLQNRYMGYGYYLSLHRHLSSAVSNSTLAGLASSSSASQPFGAKPVDQEPAAGKNDHSRHGFTRGFAPPTSYSHGAGAVNRSNILHVPVKPPVDIRMIRLINKVIEGVLEHGPDYEALLMSRASVQREEKWAWIWDARSQGGVWYRWMFWGVITGSHLQQGKKSKYVPLFEGGHAWKTPETGLRFEYTTKLDEFVSDAEYDSSEDEDFDGDANRESGLTGEEEKTFLNPLEKAKLVHLLARLPTTIGKVRKGDIARVTAFAITHVSRGADEVVDLIVSNVERPLTLAIANLEKSREGKGEQQATGTEESAANENTDASAATLVGLYVVSDILSSSSTSSVRHAWRYRQLLETALRTRKVFERLGMMAEKLGWGRLRAEKWKRSVTLVLNLWEGWCVFPVESHALFVSAFENPPSLKAQEKVDDESTKKGKWKVVEANSAAMTSETTAGDAAADNHSAKAGDATEWPIHEEEEATGEPIEEDEDDVDGEPIAEDDLDGEPIEDDDDVDGEPMDEDEDDVKSATNTPNDAETDAQAESHSRGQPKRRMRAADLFADSDHSEGN
ncbi:hypothetical protein ACHAQJ_008078 [Trichoderma viride]